MKQLHQNKFSTLNLDEANGYIEQIWSDAEISPDEWKKEQLTYLEEARKYKPTITLIDTAKFQLIIEPKLQEWSNVHLMQPLKELGVLRAAIVLPEDLFTVVAIQQATEEHLPIITMQYFKDVTEGKNWLLSLK